MPKFTRDVKVQCPYYITSDADRHNSIYITCEGILGSQSNSIRFDTRNDRNDYMDDYCNYYPNDCSLCRILDEQQEEIQRWLDSKDCH